MKFTCKQCKCHFKVKDLEALPCKEANCPVKYDMNSDLQDFASYTLAKPNLIVEITSEEPPPPPPMATQAEWDKWVKENYPDVSDAVQDCGPCATAPFVQKPKLLEPVKHSTPNDPPF